MIFVRTVREKGVQKIICDVIDEEIEWNLTSSKPFGGLVERKWLGFCWSLLLLTYLH